MRTARSAAALPNMPTPRGTTRERIQARSSEALMPASAAQRSDPPVSVEQVGDGAVGVEQPRRLVHGVLERVGMRPVDDRPSGPRPDYGRWGSSRDE